jgi:hypothetical protein
MDMGRYEEKSTLMAMANGVFTLEMKDAATGKVLEFWEKKNVLTLDAGIIAARLFKNGLSQTSGLTMLALGTGATGNILSPDAPQATQRRLNQEIIRKAFSAVQFRNASGSAVAYPTNVLDFTTTYGESEGVGPLSEMSLMSTFSTNPLVKNEIPTQYQLQNYDPSFDVTGYDLLANYLTFPVISKPSTAILTITWRLTF